MKHILILILCAFVLACKSTKTASSSNESERNAVSQAQWRSAQNLSFSSLQRLTALSFDSCVFTFGGVDTSATPQCSAISYPSGKPLSNDKAKPSILPRQAFRNKSRQAVISQTLRTSPFPRGKGGVRSCTAGGRQHRNSEAVFIRQVAGNYQVKVFSSLHGKARYCRPDDDNGSSRHFLYPSLSRRQTTTFRSQAPEFIAWQLRRCIVRWRGQAIAWLSEIVGCSIAFRRFGLLLQNKYATSLIRTMSLFLECEEDKSPEVE